MSNIISVTDFRNHVSEIVNRVHYKNETIFLMRGATVVAKITGVEPSYPYARQIKAARVKTQTFLQAVGYDVAQIVATVIKSIIAGLKFMAARGWVLTILALDLFKRWLKLCLALEQEIGSPANLTKRRARI